MIRPRATSALFVVLVAHAAVAREGRFDPASATPYFASGPAAQAAARFRAEDWAGAVAGFDAYLKKHPKAADHRQAEFLDAWARSKLGQWAQAARQFDALVESYPLLADHHRLHAARALLAAKQYDAALARADKIDPKSPLAAEGRMVRAQALAALGRHPDAAAAFEAYLDDYATSFRKAEATLDLAVEKEAQGDWPRARELYRTLYVEFPVDAAGIRAAERLKQKDPGALSLTASEHRRRGLALFEAMRNPEAEAELRAALSDGKLPDAERCEAAYHLAQTVFKERDRPRAAPLFDDAVAACAACAKQGIGECNDLHMKSLYQGGRCHAARGDLEIAAQLFARAEAEHPTHSYADDARLRGAETYDALAQRARATPTDGGVADAEWMKKRDALLADLADKYPTGDVRSEALFRLFFAAWKEGRTDDARKWLETALVKVPHEDGWWDAGRTLYWLGRVADHDGKLDQAIDDWSRCAREYPLSYYALQALSRLHERAPKVEQKLIAELARPAPSPSESSFRFAPRKLFDEPAFRRGVELARLGLGAEARRELAAAGIRTPDKGEAVDSPEREELLWLATVLYDRAGEWALSHWIPRHTLTAYSRTWPVGDNRKKWLLSYPRGFADLIVPDVKKTGQPAALEFAIVREESAFDPLTESFANAIGLTQLTAAPAKRFAQGLPWSREALHDPAINVAIGTRELGYCWSFFDGSAPLAIAAYNAGDGAVKRWLRAAPTGQSLDEWIESIPYDETRGYTKRVLSSYFAYRWLYEPKDPVPLLSPSLPRR